MMKRIIICLIIFFILSATPSLLLSGPLSRSYAFSGENLSHVGLVRISDILRLIDEMDSYSIDGYTWQGVFTGSEPYQQQNWIVLLDGHQMNLKTFQAANHADLY